MPALPQTVRTHLLKRLELYVAAMAVAFTATSVVVVLAAPPPVVVFAVAAFGIGAILGVVQWADRERQKRLRVQAIHEIREMLTDQVLNQLAAMKMWMAEDPDPSVLGLIFEETDASIDRVAEMINGLSEQQLDTWRLTYANVADHVLEPPTGGAEPPAGGAERVSVPQPAFS